MVQYVGYSSIAACKSRTTNSLSGDAGGPGGIRQPVNNNSGFTLVDAQLVIQDFINALNIRKGTKVGQPGYGTILWDLLFEPNDNTLLLQVENEVRRVASLDPRLQINIVSIYPSNNGVLLEMELAVVPFNQAQLFTIFINRQSNTASLQ